MTHFVTIEELPLKLRLLRNPFLGCQLFPFSKIGLLGLGALSMLHHICLFAGNAHFLLGPPVVFYNAKSKNQILHIHLLSLVLR